MPSSRLDHATRSSAWGLVYDAEAKRYLVACQVTYRGTLAADSVASLALQGGPMSPGEQGAFELLPHARDALLRRSAEESGKVDGLVVGDLGDRMPVVRRVSATLG